MQEFHVSCSGCHTKYQLGVANTVLYLYRQRRYLCWLESICHCGEQDRNFLEPDEAQEMLAENFPAEFEEDCPIWVIREWERINDIELVEPVELTPRHEELIESLRVMLELTPDHHLMDIFSSPPPKTDLPRMWT